MKRLFLVTRHPGALEWLEANPLVKELQPADIRVVPHVREKDWDEIGRGDVIAGTLPVHLVSRATLKGVRYLHIEFGCMPCELRGQELSKEQMIDLGATLTEYAVTRGRSHRASPVHETSAVADRQPSAPPR